MSAGEAKTLNVPSHQATLIGIPAPVPVHPPHRGSSTPDSPPVKASAPPEPAAGTDVLASSRLEANGAPSSADAEAEIERRRTAETVRLGPRRTSAEPVSHSTVPQAPDARGSRSTRGLLMVSAVIAAAILGGRYFLLQTQAAAPAAPEPPRVAVAPPASPENRAVPSPTPEAPAAEAP
ncbi:MAG TPA: hypothetical protein VGK73_00690, partial [Polyangiaceae bacterium]